jgi:hypothetical protein
VQGVYNSPHLQRCRAGRGGDGDELLGGLAQVAGVPQHRLHALTGRAGSLGHRTRGQLLGQAELDAGELGRDLRLAQVRDRREQLHRGLGQKGRETLDELQAAGGTLQVAVRLGHDLVLHGGPSGRWRTTRPAVVTRRICAGWRHGRCGNTVNRLPGGAVVTNRGLTSTAQRLQAAT